MTKRRYDNSKAPFRTTTMTTLRVDKKRLQACLADCVALIRGDISGSVQRSGILKEADALLADGESEREGR